jgi:kinesin family member 5
MNVNCEEDIFDFLDIGAENRSVASTGMNDQSSRSHSIYTIKMQQHLTSGVTRISKLNFVDLAGSENVKKTHATGKVFKEAKNINKSLSALGLCIKALTSSQKSKHIPFRDSKLTRILQESLGGNTRTTLLVCLSPHSDNFEESLSTLRFATQAKSIKTKAKVNERHSPEMMEKIIESLQQEMRKLKQQLRRSSTIAFRRDGDVVKITNRGTQTMMMVKTDDGENEEEDEETKNSLLQQTGLPSLRDAMQSIVPTYRNRHGLFSRLVKLHTPRNDMKEDIGEDTNDDDDYDDDDDDDDVFGNIEQVLRLKQENSLLRHRILDLEQSIREQKEEEGEEENEIKESKSFTINQDAEARIRELEEKLRMSESSRQRLERLQRNSSKRRAANRISRRSLLALREAEKKSKNAKELYSTARSKLRKTNSPLLREAMLTAKVVSKMRRLSSSPGASSVSSVDSTTDSSISSSNVTPPSTPPHGEGGWNRRRSSLGDT